MPYLINKIRFLWEKASLYGVEPHADVLSIRRISTINKICLFLSGVLVFFVFRNMVLQRWDVVAIEFIAFLAFIFVIFLHGKHKREIASFLFLTIINALFFGISSLFAPGLMIEFLFVMASVVPLVIYDSKIKIYSWFLLSMGLFFYPHFVLGYYEDYQFLTFLTLFVSIFFIVKTYHDSRQSYEELIESQNMELQELNREKDELLGIAAHDLKSPLQRIKGLIQILKLEDENLRHDQKDILNKVESISQDQMDMVSKILFLYSSFEKHAENVCILFNDLCDQVVSDLQVDAISKNIQVVSNFEDTYYLMGDMIFLKQILHNLLSNAIKFSPAHTTVRLECHQENKKIYLRIIDQGPGISDHDMEKIFGKFQKLSAQPTAGESTTGLGLSIVKKYIDEMGAEVSVRNNPLGGSIFEIVFAACKPDKEPGNKKVAFIES